mmetsp:Transcript_21545/g.54135  ORF Transcript_21545/g.54135 Transcript_21545/m.54135 type:complete len:273 (-) Transcript_21545:311-1129(-)
MSSRVTIHACSLKAPILDKDAIYTDLGRVGVASNLSRTPHVRVVYLVSAPVKSEAAAYFCRHGTLIVRVRGSHSHDPVPAAAEGHRKLVGNVGEATRLRPGSYLARDDDHLEPCSLNGCNPLFLLKPRCNLFLCLLHNDNRFRLCNYGRSRREIRRCLRHVLTHLEIGPLLGLFGDLRGRAEELGVGGVIQSTVGDGACNGGPRRRGHMVRIWFSNRLIGRVADCLQAHGFFFSSHFNSLLSRLLATSITAPAKVQRAGGGLRGLEAKSGLA